MVASTMSDWKKSFIEAEQDKGEVRPQSAEPMKLRAVHYATVCLFVTGTILIISTVVGILTVGGSWWFVIAGGCVGVEVVLAGSVMLWLGRGVSNTAVAQGYLIVGVLSAVSCITQLTLLTLLAVLTSTRAQTPTPFVAESGSTLWAWIQFLGGAQGTMAVLVGTMVGVAIGVTFCCCKAAKDNVVGVYQPR